MTVKEIRLEHGERVIGIVDPDGQCIAVRVEDANGASFSWGMSDAALASFRRNIELAG